MRSIKVVGKSLNPGDPVFGPAVRLFDGDNGEEILALDLKIRIQDRMLVADVTLPVTELDVHMKIGRKIRHCMYCKHDEEEQL